MRRRECIAGAFAALICPDIAGAQSTRRFVAFLHPGVRNTELMARLKQGLESQGRISSELHEYFVGEQGGDLTSVTRRLLDDQPDVIVAAGESVSVLAPLTNNIPIVNLTGGDPISNGLIRNASRPGSNITAVSFLSSRIIAKRVELLLEIVPDAKSILYIGDPAAAQQDPTGARNLDLLDNTFAVRGIEVVRLQLSNPSALDDALHALPRNPDAVILGPSPTYTTSRAVLLASLSRIGKPAIFPLREYVREGGLMSYGASVGDAYEQAGRYVSRILAGEQPGNLPVITPTQFELSINLKTAEALNLKVPATLLTRADEVIE